MLPKIDPTTTQSWANLSELSQNNSGNIRELFNDQDRVSKYTFQGHCQKCRFSRNQKGDHLNEKCIC